MFHYRSGPNGSGKSGVIDAIEFGLTGQIGRLTGRGSQGLTVSEHGPHVDKTKFPDAAFVTLKLFLTDIGKTATITRKVASPNKLKIEPADADVKAVLAEVADHPEITLSRREILRFILVEPTKRSEEIQTILKLEEIGQRRRVLNTAQNKLQTAFKTATAHVETARNALMLHLQVATLKVEDLLEAVNKRRTLLGLAAITELTADTKLDTGLSAAAKPSDFNKESALQDLKALTDAAKGSSELGKMEAAAITADLAKIDGGPALLAAMQRGSFIERGLELLDGPECPLCNTPWETEQRLRDHLRTKLAKSEEARKLQESLLANAAGLIGKAVRMIGSSHPSRSSPKRRRRRYSPRSSPRGEQTLTVCARSLRVSMGFANRRCGWPPLGSACRKPSRRTSRPSPRASKPSPTRRRHLTRRPS